MLNKLCMYQDLEFATKLIAKVVEGENLTSREAETVFSAIFKYDHDGYHLAALNAALHAKGIQDQKQNYQCPGNVIIFQNLRYYIIDIIFD